MHLLGENSGSATDCRGFILSSFGFQVVEGEDTDGLVENWISEAYVDRLHVQVKRNSPFDFPLVNNFLVNLLRVCK